MKILPRNVWMQQARQLDLFRMLRLLCVLAGLLAHEIPAMPG
ncbi:hypothetical protein [Arthrobacter sp. E3]